MTTGAFAFLLPGWPLQAVTSGADFDLTNFHDLDNVLSLILGDTGPRVRSRTICVFLPADQGTLQAQGWSDVQECADDGGLPRRVQLGQLTSNW